MIIIMCPVGLWPWLLSGRSLRSPPVGVGWLVASCLGLSASARLVRPAFVSWWYHVHAHAHAHVHAHFFLFMLMFMSMFMLMFMHMFMLMDTCLPATMCPRSRGLTFLGPTCASGWLNSAWLAPLGLTGYALLPWLATPLLLTTPWLT